MPRTNAKAERFIQTALREWAYVRPYYSSAERTQRLGTWIDHYNCVRWVEADNAPRFIAIGRPPRAPRSRIRSPAVRGGHAATDATVLRHEHDVVRPQVEILLHRRVIRHTVVVERDSDPLFAFLSEDDDPGP